LIEHYWPQVTDAWELPEDDFADRLATIPEINARGTGAWYDPKSRAAADTDRRIDYMRRAARGYWHG
jgi:hypothetical protein